jgi:pimeloyl-ACP methyl ester carboxylesterase
MMAAPTDAVLLPALWEGMFLPQRMTPAFRDGFPFDLASGRTQLQADGQEALAMISSLSRSAPLYASCQVPVHVLQGDRDVVVNPMLHGRLLAAMLPRGQFINLPGLGHMAHHFAPGVVADSVRALHQPSEG